ncbi:disulfide isomerase [Porphyromonas cangingivalis]|uniref:Disulfide isomerase n=1 Tax=Porphyromonas cangingivalis TaxID=36874 RepID=A0A0A2EKU2_PORCN|nr:thioredoxin domain-containing protein [Porphyromonas cangingivalis]KGN78110.1 disulfide isomerase [Porphyromonas cangingivalis]
MRAKILFIAYLAVSLFAVQAQESNEKGIKFFEGTFEEGLALAQKEQKLLFVDFYAQWCGPCKRMAKTVFTQEKVGAYFNDKFINMKLDAEAEQNKAIAEKYKVEAFPTLGFFKPDGTPIAINTGSMGAEALIEAAKIAAGEAIGFEELYNMHRKDKNNLELQQQLLRQAPSFLSTQEGIDADKWIVRIRKLYRSYIEAKKGPALINAQDYIIISALGRTEEEGVSEMVEFMVANLPQWKEAVGDAVAYYIIEHNDNTMTRLVKEGDATYKTYLERIKTDYKGAYDVVTETSISPYEKSKLYYDAIYTLYKHKEPDTYISLMKEYFQKLGDEALSSDYGRVAQELYYATGDKLKPEHHRQAIEWIKIALKSEESVMDKANFMVMIGDSYKNMKEYVEARKYYNQAFAESLQMVDMPTAQQMIQYAIQMKLQELELLER